jgi:hypothetical protein
MGDEKQNANRDADVSYFRNSEVTRVENEEMAKNLVPKPLSKFRIIPEGTSWKQFLFCKPAGNLVFTSNGKSIARRDEALGFFFHAVCRGPLSFSISAFFNPYLTTLARFAAAKESPYEYGKIIMHFCTLN